MGGIQNDLRCLTCCQGFLPSKHAQAPAIAILKSRKIIFGNGSRQVIASHLGEAKKFLGHDSAYQVQPDIVSSCIAATIPIETGAR
jgi:hypothetical protein